MNEVVGRLDVEGGVERSGVEQVTDDDADARRRIVSSGVANEGGHLVTRIEEGRDESTADKARGAGDEYTHSLTWARSGVNSRVRPRGDSASGSPFRFTRGHRCELVSDYL